VRALVRRAHAQRERGTILVLTSVLLLVLLGFAALAVDLGNAWSNSRRSQSAADLAAMGGLQAVPYTTMATAVSDAESESSALLIANNATSGTAAAFVENEPFDGSPETLPGGGLVAARITVDTIVTSENVFGGLFGANEFDTESTATAIIVAHPPSAPLLPIGVAQPGASAAWCFGDGASCPPWVPPGSDPLIMAMRRQGNGCDVFADTTSLNFRRGVDHLIALYDGEVRAEEYPDCLVRHLTTMPTSAVVRGGPRAMAGVAEAVNDGFLAGNGTALWDLLSGGTGTCVGIGALPDLQTQSAAMAACLTGNNGASFSGAINSHPRFGWAIDIPDSGGLYTGWFPVWIHTFVDGSATETIAPPADPGAMTFFVLDESMLDVPLEYDPGGLDNLDFVLEE
jgi:Flp pilus assembly protein TadG